MSKLGDAKGTLRENWAGVADSLASESAVR